MSQVNAFTEFKPRKGRRALIAPSILSADFARLQQECASVMDAGADLLHLDVMDGHFVPNLTMGPAVCQSLRNAFPDALLDVHMMVREPGRFVEAFAKAGASHYTFHIEVERDPAALAARIHELGMTAGIAVNPETPVNSIERCVEGFDLVLIMSVHPGFSGQRFIEEVLEKVRVIKPRLRADQRLEIDGGVNSKTASRCVQAGCDVLVAASAIFGSSDYAAAIASLVPDSP